MDNLQSSKSRRGEKSSKLQNPFYDPILYLCKISYKILPVYVTAKLLQSWLWAQEEVNQSKDLQPFINLHPQGFSSKLRSCQQQPKLLAQGLIVDPSSQKI